MTGGRLGRGGVARELQVQQPEQMWITQLEKETSVHAQVRPPVARARATAPSGTRLRPAPAPAARPAQFLARSARLGIAKRPFYLAQRRSSPNLANAVASLQPARCSAARMLNGLPGSLSQPSFWRLLKTVGLCFAEAQLVQCQKNVLRVQDRVLMSCFGGCLVCHLPVARCIAISNTTSTLSVIMRPVAL